tara:strand:+ start:6200 stop:7645 length:1446 start_codon:yes stop_codon:yes gene_type:complete
MQEQSIKADAKVFNNVGYVKLKSGNNDIINRKLNIILSIDRSGSMTFSIDNVKICLKNIITYLQELYSNEYEKNNKLDIRLTVIVFNHNINFICNDMCITSKNDEFESVIKSVDEIEARGMTNIEKVFKEVKDLYKDEYKNIHVFMTDGEPTEGISKQDNLLTILHDTSIEHYFLGFGLEHNSRMLEYFTQRLNKSQYFYIDNIENAGMIYGEILYKAFYTKYTNIVISSECETMRFYDVNSGTWVSKINVNDMGNGDEYVYSFKLNEENRHDASCEEDYTINVQYKTAIMSYDEKNMQLNEFCISKVVKEEFNEYIKLMEHRMNVIDLMRKYKFSILDDIPKIEPYTNYECDTFELPETQDFRVNHKKHDKLYKEFTEYFKKLKSEVFEKYCKFHEQLLDDLYIHIKLFDMEEYNHMYCYARYNTQINQLSYNITKIDKSITNQGFNMLVPHHNMSQEKTTVFSTPMKCDMMRNVSQGHT